jgi:hypothetical protein
MVTLLLTHKAGDARAFAAALIESRALSTHESEPGYGKLIAKLAWQIADAMADEHMKRATGRKGDR